jgi:hypothetical protein
LLGAAGVGAGAEAVVSAFSGGGAFGLNGCCVAGFSAVVSGAGYLAARRSRAGGWSSVQAEMKNAMSSASDSHNFIIWLDEVYTASISMPVQLESQLILQEPFVRPLPILLKPWNLPGKS